MSLLAGSACTDASSGAQVGFMAGTGGGAVTVQGGLGVWTDGGAVSLASGQSASGATGGVSAKSADGGTTGAVELRSGQAAVGESGSVVVIENGYVLELATFPLRLVSVRPTQEVCLSSVQAYLLTMWPSGEPPL